MYCSRKDNSKKSHLDSFLDSSRLFIESIFTSISSWESTFTAGLIVRDKLEERMYLPLALLGLRRFMVLTNSTRLSSSLLDSKLALPMAEWMLPFLSTRKLT